MSVQQAPGSVPIHARDQTLTQLRLAEQQLADAEAKYRALVENVEEADRSLGLRIRQQAAVARFAEAAAASGDIDALFHCTVALVGETLDIEFSHVLEIRPDRTFLMRAGTGWTDVTGASMPQSGRASQAGFTLASGQPVMVDDARTETRFEANTDFRDHGIVTGITVIIGEPKRPFGVLGVHSRSPRAFSSHDVIFLQAIATLLAAAIGRRRAESVREHLLARAISAQEEERQRVARELHDETGQALTAILVGLRNVETAADAIVARDLAAQLRGVVEGTIRDVGRIARGLRPAVLDDLGLIAALQRYAEDLEASRGLAIEIRGPFADRFPHAIETTLYRIIQEALTNVAAHARARSAQVAIRRRGSTVEAVVRDDGLGFDVDTAVEVTGRRQTLGLIGMRERASLLGGTVVIDSRPGTGTKITVTLPLQ